MTLSCMCARVTCFVYNILHIIDYKLKRYLDWGQWRRRYSWFGRMKNCMISKVSQFAETFSTNSTFVGPLSIVNKHMRPKITRSGERSCTQRTLMRLFFDMCHLMIVKIARSSKTLSTDTTLVRFFATVNSSVCI